MRAIDAPKKIIQIKRNIASSHAQGNAEFNKYLKITCANVMTIISRYRVAIIGLNNKLIKSLFIFPSSSVREDSMNFLIVFIFKIIYIIYIFSIYNELH